MMQRRNRTIASRLSKAFFAFMYAMRSYAYRFFYWFYSFTETKPGAKEPCRSLAVSA